MRVNAGKPCEEFFVFVENLGIGSGALTVWSISLARGSIFSSQTSSSFVRPIKVLWFSLLKLTFLEFLWNCSFSMTLSPVPSRVTTLGREDLGGQKIKSLMPHGVDDFGQEVLAQLVAAVPIQVNDVKKGRI